MTLIDPFNDIDPLASAWFKTDGPLGNPVEIDRYIHETDVSTIFSILEDNIIDM